MKSKTVNNTQDGKKKHPLDLNVDSLTAIMDLNFKKNIKMSKKLPLTVPVRSGKREIGTI